ncbi:M20 family metallopeptidase [Acuticoccus sp. M5D2P5]|uniref:M20 family metallopeptidase n=1 Tax=Acuticoccus kalidii TaxID=2910977 RepID=UPI001F25EDBE|nr:M20 family metallopeptidase [Acuticoccus kalidii]MCF3933083.1 M20 family metallopeptidase [Acuticoccus kalidii]
MSRDAAIRKAAETYRSGAFEALLARRVAMRTESRRADRADAIAAYLAEEMAPSLEALGFTTETVTGGGSHPFLIAERIEDPAALTVLNYAHGDVVNGLDGDWTGDLSPWAVTTVGDRWYGRGVADNKGQHTINFEAMRAVIETRGRLGFNAKVLVDMGEEIGCPGLRDVALAHRDRLAADLLVASDGPRFAADRPTLFMGSRAAIDIILEIDAREGAHHSGNWGGLLSNPGIQMAHALAAIVGPTGQIKVPGWTPDGLKPSIKAALSGLSIATAPNEPSIDPAWGEPGLSPAEQVYGWCSFEVLAFLTGDPAAPVSAIPPRAMAHCQLRFTADIEPDSVLPALRAHLDAAGFPFVSARPGKTFGRATRLDPDDPWVVKVAASVEATTGAPPVILPNFGGTLPNDVFAEIIGMPTIWIPHSYPGCSQHAVDEHIPVAIVEEGLRIMAGVYWDLGEMARP